MREEGKVRAAGCLRLELVGDAAAAVMDVAEAELLGRRWDPALPRRRRTATR